MRILAVLAAAILATAAPSAAQARTQAQTQQGQTQAPATVPDDAEHVMLSAPDGRQIDVSVWSAAEERGVVVFSHGYGGRPQGYHRIIDAWTAAGFTVVAPLHVDSRFHPDRAAFDRRQGFIARLTDLAVVRGFVKTTRPGRPLIAAGHSFGSLMSLIEGGAVTIAGPHGDPDVKAVVALSSPGAIPGLITPETTWAGVSVPVLVITGDADHVSETAPDWRVHRAPFDLSPAGDKMLLVFAGGEHNLVAEADPADFALIAQATTDFMRAYGIGDAEARARLDALADADGVVIERR